MEVLLGKFFVGFVTGRHQSSQLMLRCSPFCPGSLPELAHGVAHSLLGLKCQLVRMMLGFLPKVKGKEANRKIDIWKEPRV
eukprot:5997717-Amphidinium_carterae.1